MTILLTVYLIDGGRVRAVGKCNTKCYNGKPKEQCRDKGTRHCVCICRGKNHAVGLMQAVRNIAEDRVGLRPHYLEHFAKVHHYDATKLLVVDRVRHQGRTAGQRAARALAFPPPVPVDSLLGRLLQLDRQGLRTAGSESAAGHPGGTEFDRERGEAGIVP